MDAVEDIKQRLSVEDVVAEYVQLKRAGRNYKGLSPFTSEKTPSLMVSPEKQIWHDFSSGKGGDIFSLVMELEGLDFRGALEYLARKAGVDLAQYQTGRSANMSKLKERLYEANELAARFYQTQFKRNDAALDYILRKRLFTKDAVLAFRIGYSPNTGSALINFLRKKGFTEAEMTKAGLTTKRYRGAGDMFRGRIQIPLMDAQGKVIGFTARLLEDEPNSPKYLNTPQTLLYDKGRHVYGLHLAKDGIRAAGYVVVVEGNLDVIASHQAGITNVVATAGTAMTEMHLKELKRFTTDIRLAFDQDKAGLAAAERAIPIAGRAGVELSMISVPEGKDPDELVRKNPTLWREAITNQQYAVDWLMDRYAVQLDLKSAVGKRRFSDVILKVVRQLPDQVERDHYIGQIAKYTSVSRESIEQKMYTQGGKDRPRLRKIKAASQPHDARLIDLTRTQNQFMALILMQPALRHYLKPITYDMLPDEQAHQLLRFLQDNPQFAGDAEYTETLSDVGDYVKILSLLFDELYRRHELLELRDEAARLQEKLIKQYVKTKKQPISAALLSAEGEEYERLLGEAAELDKLLKRL